MIIEDIHTYLDRDYYIGEMPVKTEGVWIVASPSPPPNPSIGYYEQNVDFWARFRNYQDSQAELDYIFETFHRKVAYNLENYHVYLSASNSLIEDMDRDIEGRKMLKLSIRFIYREREDIS